MVYTKAFTNWPLVIDAQTAQAGTAVYVDVSDLSLDTGLISNTLGGSGDVYNTFGYLQQGGAVARVATMDIKTFLDACGSVGMLIDAGVAGDGVILYFQKYAAGGTRATGANQHSTTIANGLMVPRTLTFPHRGNATLTADIFGISSDGSTSPIVFSEAATLPGSVYPITGPVFTLGKVDLNGTAIQGDLQVTYDFGISVVADSADSDIYPTIVYIDRITPSLTVTSRQIDISTTLTENGIEYAASQVALYGRKRDEGGTYVADVTAEHVKLALGKCRVDMISLGGSPQKQMAARFTPWYTAAGSPTLPVTVTTATAIT